MSYIKTQIIIRLAKCPQVLNLQYLWLRCQLKGIVNLLQKCILSQAVSAIQKGPKIQKQQI